MILQELCAYYARMCKDPKSNMPQPGRSTEKISFALRLRDDGSLAGIDDLRDDSPKRLPRQVAVPAARKRSANIAPNFLWDNSAYVLGVDGKGKPDRTAKAHAAFRKLHEEWARTTGHRGLQAVAAFLRDWSPERFSDLPDIEPEDLRDSNLVFRWDDSLEFIHDDTDLTMPEDDLAANQGDFCLVTGRKAKTAVLHPPIKGVRGCQPTGGSIVSFNQDAFTSYGKVQSRNAPVSEDAAAAYVAALNYLLNRTNRRCVQIADASTVFWAEEDHRGEELLHALLGGRPEQESTEDNIPKRRGGGTRGENSAESDVSGDIGRMLTSLQQGKRIEDTVPGLDPEVRYFILGLSPNAARISVRFWMVTTFGDLAKSAARHHEHIGITPQYPSQPKFPTLFQLLVETAPLRKADNICPALGTGLLRSMLFGDLYPQALLTTCLGRIQAEKEVPYARAALIKGCLVRNYKLEVPFMLDEARRDVPYLLGRLFAILEKTQTDALGSVNASIRSRYIGSASTMPGIVFPRLLQMAQHHIKKSDYGALSDRRISEVSIHITNFPKRLKLQEQGMFFLGYYQQRDALYQPKASKEEK